jgi:Holliday junction resolvase
MTGSARGIDRERKLRVVLASYGYWTMRAAGSLGVCDIIAMRAGEPPMFLEVKSTAGGPYERFGPVKRKALADAAQQAGAVPWLVWWPKGSKPVWIAADAWPRQLGKVAA